MHLILSRIIGAILGPFFGLARGSYVLGLGLLNAVGATGLIFLELGGMTWIQGKRLVKDALAYAKRLGLAAWGVLKEIGIFLTPPALQLVENFRMVGRSFPNPLLMGWNLAKGLYSFGKLLLMGLAALIGAALVLGLGLLVASLVGGLSLIGRAGIVLARPLLIVSEVVSSLLGATLAFAVLPLLGFVLGLAGGLRHAFNSMFKPSQARAQGQLRIQSIHSLLQHNLETRYPVGSAMTASAKNKDIKAKITALKDCGKVLPANISQEVLKQHVCSITTENLLELSNDVITLEYQTVGSRSQGEEKAPMVSHYKVFDKAAFLALIQAGLETRYIQLPEGRVDLTGANWTWNVVHGHLERSDGAMKIFPGISPEFSAKLVDEEKEAAAKKQAQSQPVQLPSQPVAAASERPGQRGWSEGLSVFRQVAPAVPVSAARGYPSDSQPSLTK